MHRSKRKRNIVIFSLIGVLLCMVVGYAAFQTRLEIKGTSKVTSNWNILITNVTDGKASGTAENAIKPSWNNLKASMEANLYDKGDAMEYDVTIENKGTLDAKLNDIITNMQNSNSDAVIITFSGYTKGEILKSGNTKVVHVKIEYNPEYEGGETSSEVKINFDYTQNNNEENNPDSQYLLTYDYSTNGGNGVERTEEYFGSGSKVDLSNKATKEGWTFVGWNTDKDAETGLKSYQMPVGNTTLYAIYSKTLKVTYEQGENITSIGKTNDSCNIYNNETSCEITLPEITATDGYISDGWYSGEEKIGDSNEKYTIKEDTTLTSKAIEDIIELSISTTSTTNSITVVANATSPSGIVKYEYSKDGGNNWIDVTSNTYTFTGLTAGTGYDIKVRVTSKIGKTSNVTKTTVTSSLVKPTFSETSISSGKTITIKYPSGCGNGLTCSYQKDNGNKVTVTSTTVSVGFTSNGSLVATVTDGTNTASSSYTVTVNAAEQLKSTVVTSGNGLYVDTYESGRYVYKGSSPNNYINFNNELWRIISVETDNTIKIVRNDLLASRAWDTSNSNKWARPATINTYLNGTYYSSLTSTARNQMISHTWRVGTVTLNNNNLATQISNEKATTWTGNVGLICSSDYLRANTNNSKCGTMSLNNNNYSTCKATNWLVSTSTYWVINGDKSNQNYVLGIAAAGNMGNGVANYSSYNHRPAVYLRSNIILTGQGTKTNPYIINN